RGADAIARPRADERAAWVCAGLLGAVRRRLPAAAQRDRRRRAARAIRAECVCDREKPRGGNLRAAAPSRLSRARRLEGRLRELRSTARSDAASAWPAAAALAASGE